MPSLLYKEFGLVKGKSFDTARRVGDLMQAIKVYNLRGVDELLFLDVAATSRGSSPDFELVDEFADECFMPLTVGGGIRSIHDVKRLLEVGADKVAINTAAVEVPGLIREAASVFGSQCIVVSIDVRITDGQREVWTRCGTQATGMNPVDFAMHVEAEGAGEIVLTSIDRDGTMTGYDVELTRAVSDAVAIPVIASGGAGTYEHMAEVLKEGRASAVCAAAMFHFTQATPLEAKLYLDKQGLPVRL